MLTFRLSGTRGNIRECGDSHLVLLGGRGGHSCLLSDICAISRLD